MAVYARSGTASLGIAALAALALAAGSQGCGAVARGRADLGKAEAAPPTENGCTGRIDAVAKGLIDAGYRIASRYDPTRRRPGAISAKALDPAMADITVTVACHPEFRYSVAGAGVFGLTGAGTKRAKEAIDARLAGKVAGFALQVGPASATVVRASPSESFDLLAQVGVSALDVEVRNRFDRPLTIHAGAMRVVGPNSSAVPSIDPAEIGDRLALKFHRLDRETVGLLSERQLRPVRLAPGETARGLVYFDGRASGRLVTHALTDDLQEVRLTGEIRGGAAALGR